MRSRIPVLVVSAAVVAAALSGCSASGNDASCTVGTGDAVQSLIVDGGYGKSLDVKVPTPINATKTQREVISAGHGAPLEKNQFADLSLAIYDGGTGQSVQTGKVSLALNSTSLPIPGLINALQCTPVGSRVAIVVSPKDGADQLGASSGRAAVVVADVEKSYPTRANGAPRPAKPGFPTIVLAPNGQPGITIPADQPAPKKLVVEVLKQGGGAVLKNGKAALANYTIVNWDAKTVANSTWTDSGPVPLNLSPDSPVLKALIGQKVGTQLVMNVPAADNGGTAAAIVFDIVGQVPAQQDPSTQQ